jgi:hypothetical protein
LDYFGEAGTIRWFVDYENLAAFEKIYDPILGDQEYWQKVNQGVDLIVEGSVFDTVMRAI